MKIALGIGHPKIAGMKILIKYETLHIQAFCIIKKNETIELINNEKCDFKVCLVDVKKAFEKR